MDEESRQRILEEERFRQSIKGKNKTLGLILTFFFPVLGFLYSTNYLWALVFFIIDIINFFLTFIGIGIFSGLLTRIVALFIANYGMDRYKRKLLERTERRM